MIPNPNIVNTISASDFSFNKSAIDASININIQIGKKNEKYLVIDSIVKNLVHDVLCKIEPNKKEFQKEIKLIKKERNKTSNTIKIFKTQN